MWRVPFSINNLLKILWDEHYNKGELKCQMLKTLTLSDLCSATGQSLVFGQVTQLHIASVYSPREQR